MQFNQAIHPKTLTWPTVQKCRHTTGTTFRIFDVRRKFYSKIGALNNFSVVWVENLILNIPHFQRCQIIELRPTIEFL